MLIIDDIGDIGTKQRNMCGDCDHDSNDNDNSDHDDDNNINDNTKL